MNQFKKAKQLRSEAGQATESITDLTTAGVTQKPETIKASIPSEKTEPQNIETLIPNEKADQKNTEMPISNEKTISNNMEAPSSNEITIPQNTETTLTSKETIKETIFQNNTDINTTLDTKANESISSSQPSVSTADNTPISVEPTIIEPAEKIIYNQPVVQTMPNPVPSYENVIPDNIPSTPQESAATAQEAVIVTPQQNNIPITQEIISSNYTAPAVYENRTAPYAAVQPLPEPQPVQEIAPVPQGKSKKKSAPNIFAPKGEAKSMRKSLVLKPTSVKIAENYCEKNGGSFNELIQTLLDNFIDEYGL